jgi:malonyl-CoA O-methyltransferase
MNQLEDFHKNNIRQCFNRAALTYDQGSYPQQIIGNNLINFICKYLTTFNTVIDLGCGTGLITEQLARCIHYQNFYAIDISEQLIFHAKPRLLPRGINVLTHDFDQLNFTDILFDLVFSNMALHWSSDFSTNLQKLNRSLSSNGILACTVPLAGTFTELVATSRNDFIQFTVLQEQLIASGFELLEAVNDTITFSYSSKLNALRSIQATGANYLFNRGNKSLASSPQVKSLENKLSYNIGYFIARKIHHVT